MSELLSTDPTSQTPVEGVSSNVQALSERNRQSCTVISQLRTDIQLYEETQGYSLEEILIYQDAFPTGLQGKIERLKIEAGTLALENIDLVFKKLRQLKNIPGYNAEDEDDLIVEGFIPLLRRALHTNPEPSFRGPAAGDIYRHLKHYIKVENSPVRLSHDQIKASEKYWDAYDFVTQMLGYMPNHDEVMTYIFLKEENVENDITSSMVMDFIHKIKNFWRYGDEFRERRFDFRRLSRVYKKIINLEDTYKLSDVEYCNGQIRPELTEDLWEVEGDMDARQVTDKLYAVIESFTQRQREVIASMTGINVDTPYESSLLSGSGVEKIDESTRSMYYAVLFKLKQNYWLRILYESNK